METYTTEDCLRETKEHIAQVQYYMNQFAQQLMERAIVHDQSKLEEPELSVFTEYTPKLKTSTYGSDEYNENLKGMKVALDHHYRYNTHHPEHYQQYKCKVCQSVYKEQPTECLDCSNESFIPSADISQMDLLDIVEMVCDWKAATLRHVDGDITKSVKMNQDRFRYSDDMRDIFLNTVKKFDTVPRDEA